MLFSSRQVGTGSSYHVVLSDPVPPRFSYPSSTYKVIRGKPFSAIPTVEGESVQFVLKEGTLPSGLTLSPTTGVISGTAAESSRTANVTVEGFNQEGIYSVSLLLIPISPPYIKYPEESLTITEGIWTEIKPTVKYVQRVYLRSGSIPDGMELSSTNGTISGIPSEIMTTKALIAVENQDGTMNATVIIKVREDISKNKAWKAFKAVLIILLLFALVYIFAKGGGHCVLDCNSLICSYLIQ